MGPTTCPVSGQCLELGIGRKAGLETTGPAWAHRLEAWARREPSHQAVGTSWRKAALRPEPASSLQNKGLLSALQLPSSSLLGRAPGLPSSSPHTQQAHPWPSTGGGSAAGGVQLKSEKPELLHSGETRCFLPCGAHVIPARCQPCTMHIPVSEEEEVKGQWQRATTWCPQRPYRSPPNFSGGPAHGDSKTVGNRALALERIHGLDLCSHDSPSLLL